MGMLTEGATVWYEVLFTAMSVTFLVFQTYNTIDAQRDLVATRIDLRATRTERTLARSFFRAEVMRLSAQLLFVVAGFIWATSERGELIARVFIITALFVAVFIVGTASLLSRRSRAKALQQLREDRTV